MASRQQQLYQLKAGLDAGRLTDQLVELGTWRSGEPVSSSLTFFDSFDWRLHAAGTSLCGETMAEESQIVWHDLQTGAPRIAQSGEVPRFVWGLPDGELRQQLTPLLEMRALLPLATLQRTRQPLALLDNLGKTVLRVYLDQLAVISSDPGHVQELPLLLSSEPLKGYPKPAARLARLLAGKQLARETSDLFSQTMAALGLQPGRYSSKLEIDLDPALPAREALRRILHRLLQTMAANEDGTRRDLDSEFLHDFRVAVRRTRSALGQLKKVLPAALLQRMREEFAWLGQITGPTRDLDVYLLNFTDYRDSLPAEVRADLDPLHAFLQRHQRQEQRLLVRRLNSRRYHALIAEWQEWLDTPADDWVENAELPIGQLAGERISKTFQLVLKEGTAITDDSPASELHELRKTCKKLRYLLEFFQSLYPAGKIRRLVKALKGLQDNLGTFQDLSVQAETLRRCARQMAAEGEAPPATLLAMGMLVDHLLQRELLCREEFAERFAGFSSPGNRRLFNELLSCKEN